MWENQGLTLTLQQFEFVAERRVGTKESSGRGENGMCKVTYCLYSNSKREWARNREVVFPINGQGRPGEAFPLGKVPNPQQCTNEEKAPPRPRPVMRGGAGVQPDYESDTWTHTTHIPEPGYFKNVLYTK